MVTLLTAGLARGAELSRLEVQRETGRLVVSAEVADAFDEPIERRLDAGLEVTFEFIVQLRRKRSSFFDKTVVERYVVVTARYSNLTKMYKLTRRVDGAVLGTELTDRADVMQRWMTRFDDLVLFDGRDLQHRGTLYVRAKVKLLRRVRLLFVPADIETPWIEGERMRFDRGEP